MGASLRGSLGKTATLTGGGGGGGGVAGRGDQKPEGVPGRPRSNEVAPKSWPIDHLGGDPEYGNPTEYWVLSMSGT